MKQVPFLADVSRQLHLGTLAALLLPPINIFLKRPRRSLWKTEDPFLFNGLHFISRLLHLLHLVSFDFKRLFKVFRTVFFPNAAAHVLQAESLQQIKQT